MTRASLTASPLAPGRAALAAPDPARAAPAGPRRGTRAPRARATA